jgi:hypothetical protein
MNLAWHEKPRPIEKQLEITLSRISDKCINDIEPSKHPKKMRRRTKSAVVIAAILALAFFLAVPVVGASATGAANSCNIDDICTFTQIHFTQSLDCYFLGLRPGQGLGVYYFEGALGIGCGPLIA